MWKRDVEQVKIFLDHVSRSIMLQVGWGGFFEGGFSGFALSFVSETQLRVRRGWNGMTTAYLGNHISPQGSYGDWRRGGFSNSERRKFTGDIYKCSVCVGKEMGKCVLENSLQGLLRTGRIQGAGQPMYCLRVPRKWLLQGSWWIYNIATVETVILLTACLVRFN